MAEENDGREQEAAQKAAHPDRLLPGEPRDSPRPVDARLWIDVYTELVEYKDRLLAVTREALASVPEHPARREIAQTDQALIEAELSRFQKRLSFWRNRLGESTHPG